MTDNTHDRIARTRSAARLARVGGLSAALGVVAVVLMVAAFATGHSVLGIVAVVVAVVLFAGAAIGVRSGGSMRRDPVVQDRASRLRRAKYLDAYPPHDAEGGDQRTGS